MWYNPCRVVSYGVVMHKIHNGFLYLAAIFLLVALVNWSFVWVVAGWMTLVVYFNYTRYRWVVFRANIIALILMALVVIVSLFTKQTLIHPYHYRFRSSERARSRVAL